MPVEVAPALRGAHDLNEARELARTILDPPSRSRCRRGAETLERFRELRERGNGELGKDAAKALIRELKAVGGAPAGASGAR